MQKEAEFSIAPGTVLPNGAVVVLERESRNYKIVLAVRDADHEPYVTWATSPVDGESFWGHYFSDFNEALADFTER